MSVEFPALDTPEFNELMRQSARAYGASRFALFAVRRDPDDAIQVADGLDDGTQAILWWNAPENTTANTTAPLSRIRVHSSAETALLLADRGEDRYRLVWVDSPPEPDAPNPDPEPSSPSS
ncbi:hypothetical protein AB0I28_26870 [Phytomonospora sp. NPDC050363]|uniref:hypothetical protein n=1 Tax=Phytomonospora sp. NPDC050363 TaxID=3155642 RepID=UPI0033F8951F